MANPAHPLTFNLCNPEDEERWRRVFTPTTGEQLSAPYWRSFDEVARTWRLEDIQLERCRRALKRSLDDLDALTALYGQHRTFMQEIGRLHLEAAERILGAAARAYLINQGEMIVRARSTRYRDEPSWRPKAIKIGQSLCAGGVPLRQITAKVAERVNQSDDVVRPVLQAAGVIKPRRAQKPQR